MPADNCNLSSKAEKEVFFLFAGQTLFFAVALFFMFRNKISPRERENMWKKKKHFLTKRHSIHEILGPLNFSFGPNMEVINDLTPT